MKLLFDQNLSHKLCNQLADVFPDSQQVRQANLETADDRVIWQYARSNGFVIVSHDVDFADLASVLGTPPKVVWLRCGNRSTEYIEQLLRDNADAIIELGLNPAVNYLELFKL